MGRKPDYMAGFRALTSERFGVFDPWRCRGRVGGGARCGPWRVANASRNAEAGFGRRRRWTPARDALWDFVEPWIEDGARVAIVGAGNGDDLPLRRIARRAGSVTLIDLDPRAAQGARQRL